MFYTMFNTIKWVVLITWWCKFNPSMPSTFLLNLIIEHNVAADDYPKDGKGFLKTNFS